MVKFLGCSWNPIDANETGIESSYIFDTNRSKINFLQFKVDGKYKRDLIVKASHNKKSWSTIAKGEIYNTDFGKKNDIRLGKVRAKFLKIIFSNQGNTIFKLNNVTAISYDNYLYYQNKKGENYYIIYGGETFRKKYELNEIVDLSKFKKTYFFTKEKTVFVPKKKESFLSKHKEDVFKMAVIFAILILLSIGIKLTEELGDLSENK